jgi:hypothetical protein
MKIYTLLATCLILATCGCQDRSDREVLDKLDAIKSELATQRGGTVRWAFANKREIESAISQWSRNKMEEVKKSEALAPETEAKVRRYEALQTELLHRQVEAMRFRLPPRPGAPETSQPDKEYEALASQAAEAKAPIAELLDRRSRQATQFRDQFSTDKLIAEYVGDRFDLIVDSSDERFSRSAILYRTTGEVLDITDGVIKLFGEKAKP